MRAAPALVLLSLLATPAPARPASRPYRALGTEPFWSLAIGRSTMRLDQLGHAPLTILRPVARPSFNGTRYVGPRMTVDIIPAACSDGMSDRRYPDTVTVRLGARTLTGCGGTPLTPRRAR